MLSQGRRIVEPRAELHSAEVDPIRRGPASCQIARFLSSSANAVEIEYVVPCLLNGLGAIVVPGSLGPAITACGFSDPMVSNDYFHFKFLLNYFPVS